MEGRKKEMPYLRKGKVVYKKVNGLKKKGTSRTIKKAKAHLRVLQGVERGWKPTGKAKKRVKGG